MKIKSLIAVVLCLCMLGTLPAFAYDTSTDTLRDKQLQFAQQYDFHEGDFDKSFDFYPGIPYTSGVEYRSDGSEYECPAIYIDTDAMRVNDYSLETVQTTLMINGEVSDYYDKCVMYNNRTLVPIDVFALVGCEVSFDPDTYVGTIKKDDTVLEILPNLIGMRKNQADGYYVPLEVCARFVDDVLYVPIRAVADEFGITVGWDDATSTVSLSTAE